MCSKCDKQRKLSELAALITGACYPRVSVVDKKKIKTKGASMDEKAAKLSELGRMIRGL